MCSSDLNGISLIITLDCGIKAIDKVAYANERGIDFIICNHHIPDDELPAAVTVLDAKHTDSQYPYEHLSGCGVGFKFMQTFTQSNDIPFTQLENLLDAVWVDVDGLDAVVLLSPFLPLKKTKVV